MKIALIGATGYVGSALLKEALSRGHQVTALAAHPEKLQAQAGLNVAQSDVMDGVRLAAQLKGYDAVLSAFSGHAQAETYDYYLAGIHSIIAAARAAQTRLLVVGGAGSLEVAPGVQLVDTPQFPEQWKASALGAREALDLLRAETELDWTMLSPAALLEPGERTGVFRLGGDQLLANANGASRISVQDYAAAMLDELEQPAHRRQRFTVAY